MHGGCDGSIEQSMLFCQTIMVDREGARWTNDVPD
jgi:hypothetical protein